MICVGIGGSLALSSVVAVNVAVAPTFWWEVIAARCAIFIRLFPAKTVSLQPAQLL
jgi:hypothetical protein